MYQPPSILSISYYPSLLQTREWILRKVGFNVISARSFADAMTHCRSEPFDLVIIGYPIPAQDQLQLLSELRKHCCTRVLSLVRHGDPPVSGADCSLNSLEGPEKLIDTITRLLKTGPEPDDRGYKPEKNQEGPVA